MQVSSTITINTSNISLLTQLAKQAQIMTADKLHKEVQQAQVVPRQLGTLGNEAMSVDPSHVDSGVVSIVHSTPYARRWYFNPETVFVNQYTIRRGRRAGQKVSSYTAHKAVFSKADNPNAKDHWFEDWQPGGKHEDFCRKTFIEIYRSLLRGAI